MRTAYLVYGMLKTPTLRNALFNLSAEFRKIQIDRLANDFDALLGSSSETTERGDQPVPEAAVDSKGVPGGDDKALERYSVDLTAKARKGEIEPIVGRDDEIRQVVDILLRRRQNNPILVGEAGVENGRRCRFRQTHRRRRRAARAARRELCACWTSV